LDLSEELIKTHPELQMDTFLKGSVTSQEELDELLLPIQNAMNRYRTGLGMCLFPLIREFPLDQLGNFGGELNTIVLDHVRVCPVLPVPLVSLDDFLGDKYYIVGRGSRNAAKSYVASEDGKIHIPLLQWDKLYMLSTRRQMNHDEAKDGTPFFCVSAESRGTVCLTKVSGDRHATGFLVSKPTQLSDSYLWHMRTGHPDSKVQKLLADTVRYVTYNRRIVASPCHICRVTWRRIWVQEDLGAGRSLEHGGGDCDSGGCRVQLAWRMQEA